MMNFRNPKFTEDGRIDCEIEHPEFGWIPFTADPDDVEEHGRQIFADLKTKHDDVGMPDFVIPAYEPLPPPTPEELAAQAYRQSPEGQIEMALNGNPALKAIFEVLETQMPNLRSQAAQRIPNANSEG